MVKICSTVECPEDGADEPFIAAVEKALFAVHVAMSLLAVATLSASVGVS